MFWSVDFYVKILWYVKKFRANSHFRAENLMILNFHVSRDWNIFDLLKNWEFCLQNSQFFKFKDLFSFLETGALCGKIMSLMSLLSFRYRTLDLLLGTSNKKFVKLLKKRKNLVKICKKPTRLTQWPWICIWKWWLCTDSKVHTTEH